MITQIDTTIERLNTEADLCRNEGADDIANLLSETADLLTLIKKDPVRVLEFAHSYSDDHVRVFVNDQPAHRVDLLPATEQAPVQLAPSRTGRVYVAGPMTGIKDFNFPAFNQAADELRTLGLTVLNPADHGVVDGAEWADYLRHDLAGLMSCERIHLLQGWQDSKGARLEVHAAKALGMQITYQDGATLAKCDGNHGGPRCADPECWNDSSAQAQPAEVSDESIITEAARHLGEMHIENCGLSDIKAFARAILALRPHADIDPGRFAHGHNGDSITIYMDGQPVHWVPVEAPTQALAMEGQTEEPITSSGWRIDMSTGRPILVKNHCSVIEAEDAYYVLSLLRKKVSGSTGDATTEFIRECHRRGISYDDVDESAGRSSLPATQQATIEQIRRESFMAGYEAAEHDAGVCQKPPPGWRCTRKAGHEGPCAAVETDDTAIVRRGMDRLRSAQPATPDVPETNFGNTTERNLIPTPDHNGAVIPASPADMQVYNQIAAGYWTERKGEPVGAFLGYTYQGEIDCSKEPGRSGAFWSCAPDDHDDAIPVYAYTPPQVPEDTARLDWIEHQHLEELTMGLAIDCEHDGQYYVCGDSNKTGYGDTLRAALDAARKGE